MHFLFNFRIESVFLPKQERDVLASVKILSSKVWVHLRRISLSNTTNRKHQVVPLDLNHYMPPNYKEDNGNRGIPSKGFDPIPEEADNLHGH
jgi:hypothetical protein